MTCRQLFCGGAAFCVCGYKKAREITPGLHAICRNQLKHSAHIHKLAKHLYKPASVQMGQIVNQYANDEQQQQHKSSQTTYGPAAGLLSFCRQADDLLMLLRNDRMSLIQLVPHVFQQLFPLGQTPVKMQDQILNHLCTGTHLHRAAQRLVFRLAESGGYLADGTGPRGHLS